MNFCCLLFLKNFQYSFHWIFKIHTKAHRNILLIYIQNYLVHTTCCHSFLNSSLKCVSDFHHRRTTAIFSPHMKSHFCSPNLIISSFLNVLFQLVPLQSIGDRNSGLCKMMKLILNHTPHLPL